MQRNLRRALMLPIPLVTTLETEALILAISLQKLQFI